jgi:hypothetical protein
MRVGPAGVQLLSKSVRSAQDDRIKQLTPQRLRTASTTSGEALATQGSRTAGP